MKNSALPAVKSSIQVQSKDFLSVLIDEQIFGIPILQVQDVLGPQKVTRVPLAAPEIMGSLNLRGRIVTAIDVRKRLDLPALNEDKKPMSIVVELDSELYSLVFDGVGDVLRLDNELYEPTPTTLDAVWKSVSTGIYRLDNKLLVILNIERLIKGLDYTTDNDLN